jgi:hypothetical protein
MTLGWAILIAIGVLVAFVLVRSSFRVSRRQRRDAEMPGERRRSDHIAMDRGNEFLHDHGIESTQGF